jgi:hypothetical protein
LNLFHQLYPPQQRQRNHLQKGGIVGKVGKGGNVGKVGKGRIVTRPPLTTLIDTKTIKIHIINFIFNLMF